MIDGFSILKFEHYSNSFEGVLINDYQFLWKVLLVLGKKQPKFIRVIETGPNTLKVLSDYRVFEKSNLVLSIKAFYFFI